MCYTHTEWQTDRQTQINIPHSQRKQGTTKHSKFKQHRTALLTETIYASKNQTVYSKTLGLLYSYEIKLIEDRWTEKSQTEPKLYFLALAFPYIKEAGGGGGVSTNLPSNLL